MQKVSYLQSHGDCDCNYIDIITTGQENNTHKINKYITSSDPQIQ